MSIAVSPIHSIAPTTPSLRDEVERALSAAIISGELAPGELVSVPALAARFAVSATPVREAILDLEKRGFVEAVRNKGFRVTTVGQSDLEEIAQVRRWLEVPAVRIAATRFPHDQLPRFRALAERIVDAAAAADFPVYLAADSEFHLALMDITANSRLRGLVEELRSQTRMVGLTDLRNSAELEASAREHHLLLDHLVAGDADAAAHLLDDHIGHVLGWWSGRAESSQPLTTTPLATAPRVTEPAEPQTDPGVPTE